MATRTAGSGERLRQADPKKTVTGSDPARRRKSKVSGSLGDEYFVEGLMDHVLVGHGTTDFLDQPKFVAFAGDDYFEADEDLETLIDLVKVELKELKSGVVIWCDQSWVAALVRVDGKVLRFDPPKSRGGRPRREAVSNA